MILSGDIGGTRTRLALHDTSSAVWAGLCTWFTLLAHPVRTLRPLIGLFAVEVLIALGVGFFARLVEGEIAAKPDLSSVLMLDRKSTRLNSSH